jgi:hypothetical protein
MHSKTSHTCTCGAKKPSADKPKRKLNEYMQKVQDARKSGAAQFTYKGKTYKKMKTKTGMVVYKAN